MGQFNRDVFDVDQTQFELIRNPKIDAPRYSMESGYHISGYYLRMIHENIISPYSKDYKPNWDQPLLRRSGVIICALSLVWMSPKVFQHPQDEYLTAGWKNLVGWGRQLSGLVSVQFTHPERDLDSHLSWSRGLNLSLWDIRVLSL